MRHARLALLALLAAWGDTPGTSQPVKTLPNVVLSIQGVAGGVPIPISGTTGGGGGTVNQGTPGLSPWLVTATSLPLPTGAATDHTAAAAPSSCRLSDGAVFYKGTTPSDTQPVSGTFWQSTQPVSIATMPSTPVTGTFWQTTQPVSGAFFQATQPVSAVTLPLPTGAAQDATLTGGTQQTKITDGTNVATVKPASTLPAATDKALVCTLRDSAAVTGTFWQTTQPVSGTFWQVTQPVSGTFWQVTQPVSIASMPSTPVTGTFWQATQPVSGTFFQATQPVSIAATVNTSDTQAGTWIVQPGNTANTTPWLTNDKKDVGRQQVMLSWERVAGTAAAESALTNFTNGTKNATALTAASSYTVTAGKTLRITSVTVALTATSTIVNNARIRIRQAASSIANTSPIIWNYDVPWPIGGTVAANEGTSMSIPIPDGLEVAATQQITVTWITPAITCSITAVVNGFEY